MRTLSKGLELIPAPAPPVWELQVGPEEGTGADPRWDHRKGLELIPAPALPAWELQVGSAPGQSLGALLVSFFMADPPAFLLGCALPQLDGPLCSRDSGLGWNSQCCLGMSPNIPDPRDLPLDMAELPLKASPL